MIRIFYGSFATQALLFSDDLKFYLKETFVIHTCFDRENVQQLSVCQRFIVCPCDAGSVLFIAPILLQSCIWQTDAQLVCLVVLCANCLQQFKDK